MTADHDAFWVGRLAAAIDTAIRHPHIANPHLRQTLVQFKKSEACPPTLKQHLDERKHAL